LCRSIYAGSVHSMTFSRPNGEASAKELTADLSGSLFDEIATIAARLAARSLSSRAERALTGLQPALKSDLPEFVSIQNLIYCDLEPVAG